MRGNKFHAGLGDRILFFSMSKFNIYTMLSSRIASLVHTHFDALPARSKPNVFPDGSKEWIPMTGMVIAKGMLQLSPL